jgi:uroporphyrin-3 C-methyltransferase
MSTEPHLPQETPQAAPAPTPPAHVPRWRRGFDALRLPAGAGVVAVVIALALLAGIWYQTRTRVDSLQQELANKLAQADAYNRESRQVVSQARDTLRDLEFKVGVLESRLSETQNQRVALEGLYVELSRSRDERVLAEVEQTLLTGSQQLQLAGNLKAALIALESADSRLQRADSAQFTTLRRAIQRDIERLKVAPFVDVVSMSVKLDNLAHESEAFPLAMYERPVQAKPPPPAPSGGTLARIAREAWEEIRALVRVQRVEADEVPLIAPTQQFFLRENLRMRLLSARIALLARDEASFKVDIRASMDWLQRYYDNRDTRVDAARAALQRLSQTAMNIELPDISESLEAVRNQKLVRERGLR